MSEIIYGMSVKDLKDLPEHQGVEEFLEYPDAENLIEYQYAKRLLDERKHIEDTSSTQVRYEILLYLALSPDFPDLTPSTLINGLEETTEVPDRQTWGPESQKAARPLLLAESKKTWVAWDSLNMLAQYLLRKGKPLPPEIAEWTADVLADQWVKGKKKRRRPRPGKGPRPKESRDQFLCMIISLLTCQFDLNAVRSDGASPASACDVVAAAATKSASIVGDMNYKNVEGIWSRRDRLMTRMYEEAVLSYLNEDS